MKLPDGQACRFACPEGKGDAQRPAKTRCARRSSCQSAFGRGFNSLHLHQEKDLLFSRSFFHEIHFCATRKISLAGNICAANVKSAGCFAQRAGCAVFLHAGAFFAQDIQTQCNIRPYATARTSQELRLIKMSPYAFLAIILAAEQKNTIRRTEQMTSVRRWAIENRTNGMPAAQKAPVRSVPVVSFSPARTAKQPHCPQKSAPDALCQIMRNVKRTAGRRMRLQEGY